MNDSLACALLDHDASSIAAAIQQQKLSAVAVVEAHFERIDKLNWKYRALVTLDKRGALQSAEDADRDVASGKKLGPLHGVPITVKDSFDTAGMRTTIGHKRFENNIPQKDAWVVSRLKEAGAIVIGKSNCATFCTDIQTRNSIFGATNNPWDVTRTSGGSSGGEGAAIALGLSAMGVGSDTSGSIRIPSSYCGVYGFKSSAGKFARGGLNPLHDGEHPCPDSITAIGPLARSVRDLVLCYEILSNEAVVAGTADPPPKLLWTTEFSTQPVADEVSQILDECFEQLLNDSVSIKKVACPLDLESVNALHSALVLYEFAPRESDGNVYSLSWLFELIRSTKTGSFEASYKLVKELQSLLSNKFEAFLDSGDCWVLPATPSAAFPHQRSGWPVTLTIDGKPRLCGYWPASTAFAAPFNLLGNPSVVIPVGKTERGLPVAIQVVGKLGQDAKLLRTASYLAAKIGDRS